MKTSVDVHNYLVERDIPHELVPLQGRVRAPEHVAAVLGLPPQQVGRVVLFEGGDAPVAAVVPADREPDPSRVAGTLGSGDLRRMDASSATEWSGFLEEALPPAGLPEGTHIVVDRSLSDQEILYFPGGEVTSVLKIRPGDLLRAVDARVAQIAA
ncbi:MAG TPA: YbaK/EbsC family protein [Actinomycetota bacterium]|nr:YbaK/EbsC family protein [Actinomycetota bacterium]